MLSRSIQNWPLQIEVQSLSMQHIVIICTAYTLLPTISFSQSQPWVTLEPCNSIEIVATYTETSVILGLLFSTTEKISSIRNFDYACYCFCDGWFEYQTNGTILSFVFRWGNDFIWRWSVCEYCNVQGGFRNSCWWHSSESKFFNKVNSESTSDNHYKYALSGNSWNIQNINCVSSERSLKALFEIQSNIESYNYRVR